MTKTAKAHRRWTLLVVGDNGRVVPIRHAKGWLTVVLILLLAAVFTATGSLWLLRLKQERTHRLRSELSELREQIDNLQQERDLLMARLAVAQARLKASVANGENRPVAAPAAVDDRGQDPGQAKSDAASPPAVTEAPAAATETPAATEAAVPAPASGSGPKVAVEDFRMARDPETDALRVQFKLINVTGEEEPVSGHTIVVLKNPDLPQDRWLTLPKVPLSDGRPAAPGRGRYFAIARFNTVRFPAGGQRQLHGLNRATVFVYGPDGVLLLEKDFPVNLPPD